MSLVSVSVEQRASFGVGHLLVLLPLLCTSVSCGFYLLKLLDILYNGLLRDYNFLPSLVVFFKNLNLYFCQDVDKTNLYVLTL